jgi:dihydrolipoamide dehydrogenase
MVVGSLRQETEVVVIGGGPGGYVAAIRAADLGKEVMLIEERERLGGTCLLEGCIPSKTLINAVELAHAAREAKKIGLVFDDMKIDLDALRRWTQSVVDGLSNGVRTLLERRSVEVVHARARFQDAGTLILEHADVSAVEFKNCIIATGSVINELPAGYDLALWSSAEALRIPEIPERLVVVGGGYIGLEMGLVYAGLGSKVVMVEYSLGLLTGADRDMVDVVVTEAGHRFEEILLETKVAGIGKSAAGYVVSVDKKGEPRKIECNQVLVAIGRRPNTKDLGLENTKIEPHGKGWIKTDEHGRTVEPHIFAIGDAAPGPMLAHKATREAKVAAEVIAGEPSAFDNRAIPAVVFTDPELAWTGYTEAEAKQEGIPYNVGKFPLAALGRARTLGRTEGFVKILSDPDTQRILGVGIVGAQASELIAEGTLALEMGATLEDLLVTIHPHPTMSEAIAEAAEVAAGMPIHIIRTKKSQTKGDA